MLIIVPRKDIQDALHCICRCTLAKKYRYQIEKDVKKFLDFLRLGDVGFSIILKGTLTAVIKQMRNPQTTSCNYSGALLFYFVL